MTSHIGLHDIKRNNPLWVHLDMTDGTDQQRRLRSTRSTADTHVKHRVGTYSPQLLGSDIDNHHTSWRDGLSNLPTAALHIDSQFLTFILRRGLCKTLLQGLVYRTRRFRLCQESHPVATRDLFKSLFVVVRLQFVVEQTGISRTVRLHLQTVEEFIRTHKAIALTRRITDVGLRQTIVETRQHLVDIHSQGVESKTMDYGEVGCYLRNEESQRVETVKRSLATQEGQQRIGIFRYTHPREPQRCALQHFAIGISLTHILISSPARGVTFSFECEVIRQLDGIKLIHIGSKGREFVFLLLLMPTRTGGQEDDKA